MLDQEKSEAVGRFLNIIPSDELYISDFAFHSICIVMYKLGRLNDLSSFIQDAFINGAVTVIHLEPADMNKLIQVIGKFSLDFDDAYQYVAAEKYNLTIISFDTDFDRTERGRKPPFS